MRRRFVSVACGIAVLIAFISLKPALQIGQTRSTAPKTWKLPRTADGQPDLQGVWTNATITPLERPRELATKEFFTESEAAEYEKQARLRNDADQRETNPEADLTTGYNAFWWDRGTKVVSTR